MSRIDDLVAARCPDGVRYMTIGTVADCTVGGTPASGLSAYWDGGTIPWLSSGEVNKGTIYATDRQITQAGYDSCSAKTVAANAVVVALAGQGKTRGTVARTRIPLCTNQSLCAIVPRGSLDSDFLYHFLRTQYRQLRSVSTGDGARGGLNLRLIRGYRVPVPPLEVQREIVKILDAFTELEAGLEAELEARRQQYEHYRNSLLSFAPDIPWGTLGDVASNLDSRRRPVTRSARRVGGFPYYGANGVQDYVDDFIFDGTFLLIGEDGSVVQKDRSPVLNWTTGKIWVNNHAHVLVERPEVALRFLFFYLQTIDVTPYVTGGTQPKLNQGNLNRIPVPLPPRDEQERIVGILDRFDALVNDLSTGLPAELNARQKQYEYYRDRLLTFPEAA